MYTHAHLQTHDVHKLKQTHKHTLSLLSTKSREHLYLWVSLPCTRPYPASLLVKAQEQMGQTPEIASQCLTSSSFCLGKLGSSGTGRCLWGSGFRSHGRLTTRSPFITCTCWTFPLDTPAALFVPLSTSLHEVLSSIKAQFKSLYLWGGCRAWR